MRHRVRRIRWPALATAAVLVLGSGTAYAVTNDDSTGSYRTTRAAERDVEQVLSASGTVDAANRADLGFGTSGKVASVKVALGDTVKAGEVIATLDTDALKAAVTKAKASLARAVAQLASDEAAQADAVSDASSDDSQTDDSQSDQPQSPTPTSSPQSDQSHDEDQATAAALAQLKDQQDAVTKAQSAATAAIAVAKDALAAQQAACKDAYEPQPTEADAPGAADDHDSSGDSPGDVPDADEACSAALAAVQDRQDDVSDAQDDLAKALSTLAGTLAQALEALQKSSGGSDTPSSPSSPSSSGSSSPKSPKAPSSSDTTTPVGDDTDQSASSSAARLAADQAAIEQARADLVDARQQLGQAVLRSTRSGTVRSLAAHKGDAVAAGDVVAVVVGGRAVTVETTVPESKIGQVKVGQRVRVSTPGQAGTAEGSVTSIGLVADSSSGTASYPVTVTVEDPTIPLPTGSQALLAIVVATAHDVVTVPLSAVRRRGDTATVQTWDGRKPTTKAVTVGTVGAREVEITDGLSAGDQVVLADIDQDITGASDSINDRGGFGRSPVRIAGPGGGPGGGPVTFKSGP